MYVKGDTDRIGTRGVLLFAMLLGLLCLDMVDGAAVLSHQQPSDVRLLSNDDDTPAASTTNPSIPTTTHNTQPHHNTNHQHRHRHNHHNNNPTTSQCALGHYMHTSSTGERACQPCTECPARFGVQRRCGFRSDTRCVQCVEGVEYRRMYFGVSKCLRCTRCDNRQVVRECSATHDRVCGTGCNQGYFLDDLTNECIQCSYCYPEVPGYGVTEPMCQTPNQPVQMTCLPSLPPRHLRIQQTTTAAPDSVGSRVSLLDKKLQRLESFVSGELEEVRQELHVLRTEIKQETT